MLRKITHRRLLLKVGHHFNIPIAYASVDQASYFTTSNSSATPPLLPPLSPSDTRKSSRVPQSEQTTRHPKSHVKAPIHSPAKDHLVRRKRKTAIASQDIHTQQTLEKLFESTKSLLANSSSPTGSSRRELEQARDILCKLTSHQLPKTFVDSWIPLADQLLTILVDKVDDMTATDEYTISLLPTSDIFSSLILAYSKLDGTDSTTALEFTEKSEYWLQEMIRISQKYPNQVTIPRSSLFIVVLAAWEKHAKNIPDAVLRGERLWNQLQNLSVDSSNGNTATSIQCHPGAYYLYLSLWSKCDLPEAPPKAERILRDMIDLSKRDPSFLPTIPAYVNVISAWKKNDSFEAPERAHAVLDLLVKQNLEQSKLHLKQCMKINDVPFNATIHAWASAAESASSKRHDSSLSLLKKAQERTQNILDCMDKLGVETSLMTAWSILPLYRTITTAAVSSTTDDISRDLIKKVPNKIIHLLDCNSKKQGVDSRIPRGKVYYKAIEACCSQTCGSNDLVEMIETAEKIFLNKYMKIPRRERQIAPTIQCFQWLLEAWKRQHIENLNIDQKVTEHRMVLLLNKMEEEASRIYMYKKNPSVYAFLAKGWARSCVVSDALKRTEEIVDKILEFSNHDEMFILGLHWFHDVVVEVYENFNQREAESFMRSMCQKLVACASLKQMLTAKLQNQAEMHSKGRELFDCILDIIAKPGDPLCAKKAEFVVLKMQELHEEGKMGPPTFETFKKVLICWSRAEDENAPQRMDDILMLAESLYKAGDRNLRPDFDGYLTVITAWSKSQDLEATDKIRSLLLRIKERIREGDTTFSLCNEIYAALIRAYANSGRQDSISMARTIFGSIPEGMKTTAVYNAMIEAQGGDSNMAEELLQIMHRSYLEGNTLVKPNTETFNSVIQSWLRSGSQMTAWRADGIFKRMQSLYADGQLDVEPNSRTFDLVISALANDWGAELARVDQYLALLKEYYQSGNKDCIPTAVSYTAAIRAWCSKDDDPRAFLRAKALLDEMHELARQGIEGVKPNSDTYEVFLRALSESLVETRVELANDVLSDMRQNNVKVDTEMRSTVQRCLVPPNSQSSFWIVKVDDMIDTQQGLTNKLARI